MCKKRRVFMVRHAKSSWSQPMQKDFDRPLNDRGERDAPMMGERLKKLGIMPDLVISSTAKRAKQTAKKICDALGYNKDDIKWYEKLYHCSPDIYEEVIYEIDNDIETIFIVSHNPGITQFVNGLSADFKIYNVPTCGIIGAEFESEHWNDFSTTGRKVILFEYPKKIQ